MGEAKRRRDYAQQLADQGIERMSGFNAGDDPPPLMKALLDLWHTEAAKQPNGMLDSQDMVQALTFHLVQTIRAMPDRYKQKVIDDVCEAIREFSHTPINPENVTTLGEEAGDA